MSIMLYRKGESHNVRGIKCEAKAFDEYSYLHELNNGWCYSPKKVNEKPDQTDKAEEYYLLYLDAGSKEERDRLEIKIRETAKAFGINNWHNSKITTLLTKLGVDHGES